MSIRLGEDLFDRVAVKAIGGQPQYDGSGRFDCLAGSAKAGGGLTLTRVPERWRAERPDIVAVAQMADRARSGSKGPRRYTTAPASLPPRTALQRTHADVTCGLAGVA